MPRIRPTAPAVLLAAALLAGCDYGTAPVPPIRPPDGRPNLQRILVEQSHAQGRDRFRKDAISEYGTYLAYHPEDTEGHLEFGMLLADTENYAEALFHLRLFCDTAPDSEKAPLARQYMEKAAKALTGTAAAVSSGTVTDSDLIDDIREKNLKIAELKKEMEGLRRQNQELADENERLGSRVSSLERRIELMLSGADATPTASRRSRELANGRLDAPRPDPRPVRQPVSTPAGETQIWTVKEGDSLWSIAQKVYGDAARNVDIRNANPGKIGPKDSLTVGDKLICP